MAAFKVITEGKKASSSKRADSASPWDGSGAKWTMSRARCPGIVTLGADMDDAKRLKGLEQENANLKRLVFKFHVFAMAQGDNQLRYTSATTHPCCGPEACRGHHQTRQ